MFLVIPTGVDYRTARYPIATFSIMGVNVAVYLVSLLCTLAHPESAQEWIFEHLWLTPATSVWYHYFTAMFVHAGFLHLLGNMIYLFLFGSCVEDALGCWKYLIFYIVGGLAADFVYIAGTPEHFHATIPMGGASGAISACMGGFLILFHRTKINFKYILIMFFRFWSGEFELPSWLVVSFWFLKDLAFAILSYSAESSGGGVAFAAHTGGFLAGMGLAFGHRAIARMKPSSPQLDQEVLSLRPTPHEPTNTYILDGESQIGPFTRSQIFQMQTLGSISKEALYWQDGMPEWRNVSELRDSI